MRPIPQELYLHVLKHLSIGDLYQAATASRALHREANVVLYRNIDLTELHRGSSRMRVLQWATAVAYNPSLSELIHTLYLPAQLPHVEKPLLVVQPEITGALTKAFEAISNLVGLEIVIRPLSRGSHCHVSFEVLLAGLFRLKAFRISGCGNAPQLACLPRKLLAFLSNQPEIEECEVPDRLGYPNPDQETVAEDMLYSSLLPRLSDYTVTYRNHFDLPLIKLITIRPLVRLFIDMDHDADHPVTEIMEYLGGCCKTLRHLRLGYWEENQLLSLAEIIGIVSQRLPRLETLNYLQQKITVEV